MSLKNIVSKQNKALLSELVITDFKLRYQGSVLGYLWSLLRPLLMFLILYTVFVKFLKFGGDIEHFPIYLLLGIVLWYFFAEITSQGLGSIVGRGDLMRKIRIPRWMIVFSSSISALVNLLLNLVVVSLFMVLNQVDLLATTPLLLLLIIELYVLGLGLALFLSAAFVRFRDIGYVWEVMLQGGFYVTPTLYSLSAIPNEFFQKLLLLNPVAQVMQDARYAVVTHQTPTVWSTLHGQAYIALIPLALTVLIFIGGLLFFKSESKYFAENI